VVLLQVLIDVNMPVMNGFETLSRIKSSPELWHIPVILMSSDDKADDGEDTDVVSRVWHARRVFTGSSRSLAVSGTDSLCCTIRCKSCPGPQHFFGGCRLLAEAHHTVRTPIQAEGAVSTHFARPSHPELRHSALY
jgi:CheY-like chemotaxis protein